MKGLLSVLSILLLAGCADFKTLEELEFAALQSGDWSAVELREKSIARRKARHSMRCPSGLLPVCEQRGRRARCTCTSRDDFENIMGGL
jgi:hypothetical protein